MIRLKLLAAALLFATSANAAGLPDLGGRTVKAVTENAYVPLNFADPKTGAGIGWEYDAVNEMAKRLNFKVEWGLSSWDTMIQAIREGQFDIGMFSRHGSRMPALIAGLPIWSSTKRTSGHFSTILMTFGK